MARKPVIVSLISFMLCVMVFAVIGCGNGATAYPSGLSTQPATTTPAPSPVEPAASPTTIPGTRTEAVYFHLNTRCVTCLCFEKQIDYVMSTFFQDEINSGSLTYQVINAQDPQNAAITKKYGAVSSSFFVNTIIDGSDHIKDIQAIWDWNCRGDPESFNNKIKAVIDNSLGGQF